MASEIKRCVDCVKEGILTNRKTSPPGPRCSTHKRARRSVSSETSWERRIMALYGITADEYYKVMEYQGNVCAICQRATGAVRRLAVDHDHASGLLRGNLCRPCNRMLGHLRDDPVAFFRAADYLLCPPARAVLGDRVAPMELERLTLNGGTDAALLSD